MAGWDTPPYPSLGNYDAWKTRTPEDEEAMTRAWARRGAYPVVAPRPVDAVAVPEDEDIRF